MTHTWPTWRAVRVWQRNLDVFRKYSLPSLVGPSIGEPLLYLLGLGFGLGTLVGTVGGQRYVEFVAPGMVMSSAMFAAAYECTYGAYVRMIHQFCGVFFPLESLPHWAQDMAWLLPLTYAVRATRALMRGQPSLLALLPLLGLIPGIALSSLLAARLVRRRLIH